MIHAARQRERRASGVALTALIVWLLSACAASSPSGDSTASSSPTPSPHHGPLLSGTVNVSEADALRGSFSSPLQKPDGFDNTAAPAGTTCAAYAAGFNGGFAPPVFDVPIGTTGYGVYFTAQMAKGYHGPGTYRSTVDKSLRGTMAIDVGEQNGQPGAVSIYQSRIGGSSVMSVRGDGSGTLEYDEWGSDESRGDTGSAAAVSGTVRWTCG